MRCRVIKVGGSLLQKTDLTQRFEQWFITQPKALRNLVVVGGGAIVDELRAADERFHIPQATSHRLAIQAMSLTGHLFAELASGFKYRTTLPAETEAGNWVVDVASILTEDNSREVLPVGWHVTSDSIAAWLANLVDADDLVLLKAAEYRYDALECAADAGFVDLYLPSIANREKLRFGCL